MAAVEARDGKPQRLNISIDMIEAAGKRRGTGCKVCAVSGFVTRLLRQLRLGLSFLSRLSLRDTSSHGSGRQTAFYFWLSQTYGVAAAQLLCSRAPQIHCLFYPPRLTKLPRGHRSLAPSELAEWQPPISLISITCALNAIRSFCASAEPKPTSRSRASRSRD